MGEEGVSAGGAHGGVQGTSLQLILDRHPLHPGSTSRKQGLVCSAHNGGQEGRLGPSGPSQAVGSLPRKE